ncbi:hypothetical protein [Actinomadura madurae]|nr:hypothetical protein [Actinomadura madurae]MCP9968221.1 hypothetical protein [Actinomadura madurae]MCP9980679.1 hypothetical protein [Actinomadura madurae]
MLVGETGKPALERGHLLRFVLALHEEDAGAGDRGLGVEVGASCGVEARIVGRWRGGGGRCIVPPVGERLERVRLAPQACRHLESLHRVEALVLLVIPRHLEQALDRRLVMLSGHVQPLRYRCSDQVRDASWTACAIASAIHV